ncbi:MAG: UDP-4-amino-4,6-dideoxy-N-acetyl-beta-L-altrosamine transaminase [Pseudomonadota bacterium]
MIPYGRQEIDQSDVDAVVEVLTSDYLTQGPKVPEFESKIADYVGASHAVAVNSGTSALHVACKALGLGADDWLWTTPITFVASANCGLYCEAQVDFVDIDPATWNLCPKALEEKLVQAERAGRLPAIVVVVHLCGEPCDMQAIGELAQRYGFHVVEDASHALGARYQGEPIGCCRYSDVAVFSFHPVKTITTAEGGMAVTNSKTLARDMALLRSHGITRDPGQMTHEPDGPWYYQQVELGFNYRMTDLQAALGISQADKLERLVARRHELALRYDRLLASFPLVRPYRNPENYSGMHLYVVRLKTDEVARTHRDVFERLRDQGIGVNLHYIPVHTQPYYQALGFEPDDFPEAMNYYRQAITLPLFGTMQDSEQDQVVDALAKALRDES